MPKAFATLTAGVTGLEGPVSVGSFRARRADCGQF